MASRTRNPDHKAMLATMAETWENLAIERQAHIERQQRIAAFEAAAKENINASEAAALVRGTPQKE